MFNGNGVRCYEDIAAEAFVTEREFTETSSDQVCTYYFVLITSISLKLFFYSLNNK